MESDRDVVELPLEVSDRDLCCERLRVFHETDLCAVIDDVAVWNRDGVRRVMDSDCVLDRC